MNRHQVLTGAVNTGDQCFAVGSVEGVHFTAYAAGCDIVILASDFQRVQIIPGISHGNIQVTCIDCCTDAGKIAASYGEKVHIFEPTPLLQQDSSHKLDYQWCMTGTIVAESHVTALSWNQEGTKLLTGGDFIQIWQAPDQPEINMPTNVAFFIEDEESMVEWKWRCIWRCRPATPVYKLKFSKDGLLFASIGRNDRLVKIWYENKKVEFHPLLRADSNFSPKKEEINFSFVYIAHPRAVTGFDWRKTSKYMPRGSVANMLITSCKDNICRIWCETILPEDGLVDVQQLDTASAQNPLFHTHRHKNRFMQRLHHIKHTISKRKRQTGGSHSQGIPALPSTQSIHDFHKFGIHPNGITPGFHFHLAGSINPDTDIPLLPAMSSSSNSRELSFVVHWLNNKELHFTLEAEKLLEEMRKKSMVTSESHEQVNKDADERDGGSSEEEQEEKEREVSVKSGRDRGPPLDQNRRFLSTDSNVSYMSQTSYSSATSRGTESTVVADEVKATTSVDGLDRKIEELLRSWHQSADMLFSIHPVDGSFLVWLVDWLDEYIPGAFRQAQVSFSSRIPQAFPIGDAMTMSTNLLLYCNHNKLDMKAALKESESKIFPGTEKSTQPCYTANAMGKNSPGQSGNTLFPNVLMLSKHTNGSLNQWQITFAENSKFSTVLSVAHASRACGHRFRTNGAACHPVLPLLLTTSHHNVPHTQTNKGVADSNLMEEPCCRKPVDYKEDGYIGPGGFCSELILWRVDPVGPLSKSGGIMELARINSPEPSAFSSVAWLPTLLPSSTLGAASNSPSALFVASDGTSLRVYQAVIDARTLLTEFGAGKKQENVNLSQSSSNNSGVVINVPPTNPPAVNTHEFFNIVSRQSTSRPGCIIELEGIADAKQDWQHIQLLHVFQEQLVTGQRSSQYDKKGSTHLEAMVDLRNISIFEEHFYLVVLEKVTNGGSVLHMWRIVISSQGVETGIYYTPDTNFLQDPDDDDPDDASTRSNTPEPQQPHPQQQAVAKLSITTTKVCSQMLELPDNVQVAYANVAAGHLSSSSIYPACFAPYLITTACSDSRVRFWRCKVSPLGPDVLPSAQKFEWVEWEMMIRTEDTSAIRIPGKPITVSAAYSGRVAVAYRSGSIKTMTDNPENRYINLCVSIYECESTGGSEWTLEDTIELKNISIPDPKTEIDLSFIYNNDQGDETDSTIMSPTDSRPGIIRTVSIPSNSTIQSIKRTMSMKDKKSNVLQQKHLVQLDWVSTEDGSHILTVGVGPKILLYAPVSSEIVQASQKGQTGAKPRPSRGILQKTKSMIVQNFVEEIRWMKLRSIELGTADSLPPLPMHISWVRDGILVVGMDNEMHVYSQWKGPGEGIDTGSDTTTQAGGLDARTLTEQSLHAVSSSASLSIHKGLKLSASSSSIKLGGSFSSLPKLYERGDSLTKKKDLRKSDSISSLHLIQDCGLFEAARLANPVLPQYHPKQLIELLNFGKIRRVKAILAHLVRCIAGNGGSSQTLLTADETTQAQRRAFSCCRALSIAGPVSPVEGGTIPEEVHLDYFEISSIPPLPIYALLAADTETSGSTFGGKVETSNFAQGAGADQDYSTLFNTDSFDEELDDTFSDDVVFAGSPKSRERRRSSSSFHSHLFHFGPAQSRLLARYLTHTQLPGLSSLDQMYLLALADTVSNTKMDFAENQAPDVAVHKTVAREQGLSQTTAAETVDDCGLRYLLAMRHHIYLLNTLPLGQRLPIQKQGLSAAYHIWAFHSEAEEELLGLIPSVQKGQPTWVELRQFGVGWWVRNINTLRKTMEKVAKAAFQVNKDPLDAAIYYLAMKKKMLLWGLFRSVGDTKMGQFFKNDFNEDRWRRAALKNAFALLGRQRFDHAAGFFLLAGAVRDAVEVCLNKLEDIQLAMVVARLYESELDDFMPENMKRILYEECVGCDKNGENYDYMNVHPDPFIRSMAYWMLQDYSRSLSTLLETGVGSARRDDKAESSGNDMDSYTTNPSVFNFYNYLRTHPLLVRQQLATTAMDKSKASSMLISGFTRGAQGSGDQTVTYVDKITPVERRLYFMTAHAHFKAGCPALALEVLSKLPPVIAPEEEEEENKSMDTSTDKSLIQSGTFGDFDKPSSSEKAGDVDWSQPIITNGKTNTAESFDWSKPLKRDTAISNRSDAFDWNEPIISSKMDDKLDLVLDFGLDDDDNDTKSDSEVESKDKLKTRSTGSYDDEEGLGGKKGAAGDIMAQQLKFIACLKIMMEELSTLATGFEVDGGQLRYQLYIWLEREVEALKTLCEYGQDFAEVTIPEMKCMPVFDIIDLDKSKETGDDKSGRVSPGRLDSTSSKLTLHEVIMAEKMDFEAKLERMAKRKLWLKANQQLVRTLLSYSDLHGSCGGGLASVRMELILLLQELQQEKTQQQLLSPLPFPTTLPLLSASVASSKTVIADPIRHLQSVTQDILHTVVEFKTPPTPNYMLNQVFVLRNLSAALSACIYQCLCDSDNFVVSFGDTFDVGMEGFTSTNIVYKDGYLMAGAQRRRRTSSREDDLPNSTLSKWPGVSSLRALLARESDEDAPKLNILLCEALISVYMSLLIHALAMYDANCLYRLVAHPFEEKMWPALYGGGVKKLVKVQTTEVTRGVRAKDELTKQRMKLHMKLMGHGTPSPKIKEGKPTYKERFVPPEVSMISYFMTKPYVHPDDHGIDYDSAESLSSSDEEEDEEIIGRGTNDSAMQEHLDPNSYSWCLLRYAIVKYILHSLKAFLPKVGIELPELPVCSPLLQSVLKMLQQWEELLYSKLELFSGPPDDYIPGCFKDTSVNGPALLKYKAMVEAMNTPFLSSHHSALPAKRLWHYLVKQEFLQDVFIRYIFKKRKEQTEHYETMRTDTTDGRQTIADPMKIIHKEQDVITAFCINQANLNCVSLSTHKETVELDISGILNPPSWLEDDTEYDIETINHPSPNRTEPEEFLIIQTPMDKSINGPAFPNLPPAAPGVVPAPTQVAMGQTGRGGSVIKGLNIPGITNPNFSYYVMDRSQRLMRMLTKRPVPGVRRMGAHPHLPYYLTGSQDGSVRLWEWGHTHCISVARQPGTFSKVTKVQFNAQGNKFGVTDGEGSLCLWQVGLGVNMSKPYLNLKCHGKTTCDFAFVGSSSLLATSGHSGENKNVCLWDTLLPHRNAVVQAFSCHDQGSPALLYAPQHQVLISGGKKGDICIFDIRQRQLRQTFQAHEAPIKCMALDPTEEYFITGSAEGDIKVWGLSVHNLLSSFPGEHAKSSLFRNMGSGVTQLAMGPNNCLYSCGADGSFKVRQLGEKDIVVNSMLC